MRISRFKVSSFRNIVSADIEFGKINIFTGKNSSGKTNLLNALSYCLNSEEQQAKIFDDNVTTFGSGYKKTTFETTLSDISQTVCYLSGELNMSYRCINPETVTFIKKIQKVDSLATDFQMKFTGKIREGEKENPDESWADYIKRNELFTKDANFKPVKSKLVFSEVYGNLTKVDNTKIINTGEQRQDMDEYKMLHRNYAKSIYQWIERDGVTRASSSIVHNYVTQPYSPQVAESVLELVSRKELQRKRVRSAEPLSKSFFAFLIADLQTNDKAFEKFNFELNQYSQGIIKKAYIHTTGGERGELHVDSPNGPKSVRTISSGSSVILFFTALKNWLKLPSSEQSYDVPTVMIFDEIDSNLHPILIPALSELLYSISEKVQIFLSTHSALFLDQFKKEEVYLLKDPHQFADSEVERKNIFSYKEIIDRIEDKKGRKQFEEESNSKLFIEGSINSIFYG